MHGVCKLCRIYRHELKKFDKDKNLGKYIRPGEYEFTWSNVAKSVESMVWIEISGISNLPARKSATIASSLDFGVLQNVIALYIMVNHRERTIVMHIR